MLSRTLNLMTLAIGVFVVSFLYLPSVVVALAVRRLENLRLGQEQRSTTAVVEQSETLRERERQHATASIAIVPDEG